MKSNVRQMKSSFKWLQLINKLLMQSVTLIPIFHIFTNMYIYILYNIQLKCALIPKKLAKYNNATVSRIVIG